MKKRMRRTVQAYHELPWRRQIRWLTWALAAVVVVAAVIALEVHLSSQAMLLGYQVQSLRRRALLEQREIVDMETQLAEMQAMDVLLRRAEAQGYGPVLPSQAHFVPVPAEIVAEEDVPVPHAVPMTLNADPLPEAYTISLLRWLNRYLLLEPTP